MIRVDRARVPTPAVLNIRTAGKTERERAIAAFLRLVTFKFDYARYKEQAVRDALFELFHGKCAYCESSFAATQPMDVEHWRPKKQAVNHGDIYEPGYFWLGAEWENLLPSCIDCNRARKYAGEDGQVLLLGKANLFPVEGPPLLERGHPHEAPLDDERPLLLDPCTDSPDEHLLFRDDGFVVPRVRGGVASAKAVESIETYGLNRPELVQDRLALLRLLQHIEHAIERLWTIADRLEDASLQLEVLDLVAYHMAELRRRTEPAQPYSALAAAHVQRWRDRHGLPD